MKEFFLNKISAASKKYPGRTFFQPKLSINKPNDVYEQEADSVAEQVMRMPVNRNENTFFKPVSLNSIQRKCAECDEEEKLQRKEISNGKVNADNELEEYIGSLDSHGDTLSNNVRSFFEPRFGYDFSNVRIHSNSAASNSAQSINALAYTSGNNIVFNQNQYSPETDTGKRLLSHELTHVIQQSGFSGNTLQKQEAPKAPPVAEDTPCERASFRHEAKIPCPGEYGGEFIIKPCLWTMFKNYGPCKIYIYPILKDTPKLKAYGELTELEPGEVRNVAAPKECIRFEVGCSSSCDLTGDTRIRWGPPCVV